MSKPSDPMYVEIARISAALADIKIEIALDLPKWLWWYRDRLLRRALDQSLTAYKVLAEWEWEKHGYP